MIQSHAARAEVDIPNSVDWSTLVSLQSPFDQGGCGSCWAVAATYALRAHYEICTSEVKSFSVQTMLNCAKNPNKCGGTGGCGGATAQIGFQNIKDLGGFDNR